MPDIVLTTFNARFAHTAFGLRCLHANLGPLRDRAVIREFDLSHRPLDALETILADRPRIVGIGVYLWNVGPCTALVAELKRVRPDIIVVLGGPEVSYETHDQPIAHLADYVIAGEGDLAFAELCGGLLHDRPAKPQAVPPAAPGIGDDIRPVVLQAPPPDLSRVALPYDLYTDADIAHRVIYVEASRGCPFSCEFCLSSLDVPVRQFPLEPFLGAMQKLLDRGTRQFKFVDRTFNLNIGVAVAILRFFLERHRPGVFLHFEMIPDRLPETLREWIVRFPPGVLQFEVGVQTFNPRVAELISRRQDHRKVEDNLRWLREQTTVHVHADLIAGLPGEDLASFAAGFDRLVALKPHEIQVGILKRLRGTPIVRHDAEWGMVYSPIPPYEVMQTRLIDFATIQRLRRFARYWDLVGNSGRFVTTAPLLWSATAASSGEGARLSGPVEGAAIHRTPVTSPAASPFAAFLAFSDWLFNRTGQTHGIALPRLAELLFTYLTQVLQRHSTTAAQAMWHDLSAGGQRPQDVPAFLHTYWPAEANSRAAAMLSRPGPRRQARHRRDAAPP